MDYTCIELNDLILGTLGNLYTHYTDADEWQDLMELYWSGSSPDTKRNQLLEMTGKLRDCILSIQSTLLRIHWASILYCELLTAAPWENGAPDLTWREIAVAFGTASDPGRMWLVTEMDRMRELIWDKNPNIKWAENPFA